MLLMAGVAADHFWQPAFFAGWVRAAWYAAAYLCVGLPVLRDAWKLVREGSVFTEFTLMSVASLGAFAIGEYAEGVAVMLFYSIGELFQEAAVGKARRSVRSLLDLRPSVAVVLRGGEWREVSPTEVAPGERIRVRPGERVPLDARMVSAAAAFNTSALTGESTPRTLRTGDEALAGMVNLETLAEMDVVRPWDDSSLARILEMVQNAPQRRARTELMVRRFARVYTPLVFALAALVTLVPWFVVDVYDFGEWFYRGLVFLVVSCPCALVISIPLGYFGGIGAASRNGILFKGANFLDQVSRVDTVVLDKTGTVTEGVFEVVEAVGGDGMLRLLSSLEASSTHPAAKAVVRYAGAPFEASGVEEIPGYGLRGRVDGHDVLAGNVRLMAREGVAYPAGLDDVADTVVACAVDGVFAGHVVIADRMKPDAAQAVADMRREGVGKVAMLSGDRTAIVERVAYEAGIDLAYGDLLPQDKVRHVEELMEGHRVAFVGDGINDAPVLAVSDVGIAMGAMGSDAAIETADVVIQSGRVSQVAVAMRISRATRRIVVQNIVLAMGVKAAVMALGAFGIATMWEAVFADVGVALLAILNAVRVQRMKF